jgi:hypothetical protein
MPKRMPRFTLLAVMFAVGVMIAGVDRAQAAPDRDSFASECEPGTVASYLGTTCALPPAVYRWLSYECTSTPSNICNRLGKNGEEIHIRRDPNGPNTLLVGGTDRWNVKAGESIHVVIRGNVYGATGNNTWPHFHQQRASTGDGYEENITKVDCGENCIQGDGSSAFRCDASSPEENCSEQHRIAPYMHNVSRFRPASADSPYPFTIEVKMSGGTNGTASLRSLGLHISAIGQGGFNRGGFQGRRRPF